ncbi:MAG TPA: acyl-CoA synthetase [bacterium]|nr:acyl-CoA synthetase [bacterium]
MLNPDNYNLALDCVDKHADLLQNKHKVALVYLKEDPASGRLREPPLKLSYSSLKGLTNAMANGFASLGLERGSRVLLRLANSTEFLISFLGAVKAGLIPVPTSPLLTWPELEYLLRDSGAAAFVTSQELLPPEFSAAKLPAMKEVILASEAAGSFQRWQDLLKNSSTEFRVEPTQAEDPAYWLYTSGTEGKPKAVIHAHRSIPAHDARARLWQDLKAGDVVFNTSALNWSYALTAGWLDVWRHGLTSVIYQGRPRPELIAGTLARHGVTVFMSVPGIYRRLLPLAKADSVPFSGLRVALSAGEKLGEQTREEFRRATGLEIREGLGMTEHSVYLVQALGQGSPPGSCGRPLPEQKIAILKEDLSPCPPGESGILASHRSCPGLMLGYHGEAAGQTFQDDWFLSGDLAYRDEADHYFFLGRRDEVLNSGGYRVSPLEIEAALNEHPAVEESAAVSAEPEPGKSYVQAFVVLKAGPAATQETAGQILRSLESRLAQYKIPRQIVFLRELPKTSNGKLQRHRLKNLA